MIEEKMSRDSKVEDGWIPLCCMLWRLDLE